MKYRNNSNSTLQIMAINKEVKPGEVFDSEVELIGGPFELIPDSKERIAPAEPDEVN